MTTELIRHYALLIDFLGTMLGPDYEISLHDLEAPPSPVIAIANGHVSGRTVGAPLPDLAMQLIQDGSYQTQDWKFHYRGISACGKLLRCSTLFIKDEQGKLIGLLCINFDDSRYRELSEKIFSLCHPDMFATHNIAINTKPTAEPFDSGKQESFLSDTSSAIDVSLMSIFHAPDISAARMTYEEKLMAIRQLEKKGAFALKGSVPLVAKKLSCSPASIYRYLSKIRKESQMP